MTVRTLLPCFLALGATACGSSAATCGPEECEDVCAKSEGSSTPGDAASTGGPETDSTSGAATAHALNDFEWAVLEDMVVDLRDGVRPFDDQSLGLCRKGETKKCGDFLGLDPGELPAGEYLLHGSFAVPRAGEKGTWKVKLETECVTERKSGTSKNANSSEYTVVYGGQGHGYVVSPMRTVQSPASAPTSCTYTIKMTHPDGDQEVTGGWKLPGPPE